MTSAGELGKTRGLMLEFLREAQNPRGHWKQRGHRPSSIQKPPDVIARPAHKKNTQRIRTECVRKNINKVLSSLPGRQFPRPVLMPDVHGKRNPQYAGWEGLPGRVSRLLTDPSLDSHTLIPLSKGLLLTIAAAKKASTGQGWGVLRTHWEALGGPWLRDATPRRGLLNGAESGIRPRRRFGSRGVNAVNARRRDGYRYRWKISPQE